MNQVFRLSHLLKPPRDLMNTAFSVIKKTLSNREINQFDFSNPEVYKKPGNKDDL